MSQLSTQCSKGNKMKKLLEKIWNFLEAMGEARARNEFNHYI